MVLLLALKELVFSLLLWLVEIKFLGRSFSSWLSFYLWFVKAILDFLTDLNDYLELLIVMSAILVIFRLSLLAFWFFLPSKFS